MVKRLVNSPDGQTVEDFDASERDWIPPVDWTVRIAATRYDHETKGTTFTHSDGNTYGIATDRQSQAMVTGAKVSLNGSTDTVQWKTAQGFVTVDAADMDALAKAVRTHVQAAFDREAELEAKVADGTITRDDLDTGWP